MTNDDRTGIKKVTDWLKDNIIQNVDIMISDGARAAGLMDDGITINETGIDLVCVIVYLHNRLSEEITGNPYNYMFHWANKIGSWVDDVDNLDQCIYRPADVNEDQ